MFSGFFLCHKICCLSNKSWKKNTLHLGGELVFQKRNRNALFGILLTTHLFSCLLVATTSIQWGMGVVLLTDTSSRAKKIHMSIMFWHNYRYMKGLPTLDLHQTYIYNRQRKHTFMQYIYIYTYHDFSNLMWPSWALHETSGKVQTLTVVHWIKHSCKKQHNTWNTYLFHHLFMTCPGVCIST